MGRPPRRTEPKPLVELRLASPTPNVANPDRDGLLLPDKDREPLAASDAGDSLRRRAKKPSVAVSSAGLIEERRALLDLWSRRRRSEAAQIVDFEGVKKT